MQKVVKKPEKVALCQECGGTGSVETGRVLKRKETCPLCEGSGRVLVSGVTTLEIRAYHVH